jgi:hypothetical protein
MFLDLPDPHPDPFVTSSVADPGYLSRILIFIRPGSRIPDTKTATKERGEKKLAVVHFFVATNFTKLKIILFLKCRKKIWINFKNSIFTKLSKIWVWDPGPGKNL